MRCLEKMTLTLMAAAVVVLQTVVVTSAATAPYITAYQYEQCYSTFALTATNTPVGGVPVSPLTIFSTGFSSPSIAVDCVLVATSVASSLTPSQANSCLAFSSAATLSLCETPVSTGVTTCSSTLSTEALPFTYKNQSYNITQFMRYATTSSFVVAQSYPFTLSIAWYPSNESVTSMPSYCYPQYLTTLVVARDTTQVPHSSLVAVIIFVCIAAVVVVIVLIFGRYQIRKLLSKFDKKVTAKPPKGVGLDDVDAADGEGGPGGRRNAHHDYHDRDAEGAGTAVNTTVGGTEIPEEEFRAMYGSHAIRPNGVQRAELVDGIVVTTKPFVQPWYQRTRYVETNQPGQAQAARTLSAPRPLQVSRIPPAADADLPVTFQLRRRQLSPPQHGDDTAQSPAPMMVGAGPPTAVAGSDPRRLQFPSPVHPEPVAAGVRLFGGGGHPPAAAGSSPAPRVLNPYDELSY